MLDASPAQLYLRAAAMASFCPIMQHWGRELAGRVAGHPLDDDTLDQLDRRFSPAPDDAHLGL